ncbi:protein of unknown function [Methylocella tundrae]|uniref:Uncharacterized protein n=1 Tax=Methylocella tundrae TaxID=227605 RepID=A0A4U8YX21_METTU|nr:protein of unknown function [Methylocella tundrae]
MDSRRFDACLGPIWSAAIVVERLGAFSRRALAFHLQPAKWDALSSCYLIKFSVDASITL